MIDLHVCVAGNTINIFFSESNLFNVYVINMCCSGNAPLPNVI